MRPISPEQEGRILQKFRLDWNYHSNHIEGNSLTYGETKSLLLYGITAQGKPLKDHLEITGHNEALEWVYDVVKGEYPLTETFVRELHKLLLREPYEVDAITPDGKPTKRMIQVGQYKQVPNHVRTVTGAIHYFASPEETPAEMHKLMDWYREQRENSETNPIFLAALFHHRYSSIHPFDDGNGRTGRLLMNFILMQYGFPPVVIKTEDKSNYYRALQQADGGNHDAFVEYMAVNLVRSLEIMIAGARGESIEEPDDLDKELALLEMRLKGQKITLPQLPKNPSSVRSVIEHSFRPLIELILHSTRRFNNFYERSSGEIRKRNRRITINLDSPKIPVDFAVGDEDDIALTLTYTNFKNLNRKGFDYHNVIRFVFNDTSYQVLTNGSPILQKDYSERVDSKESSEIARKIKEEHLLQIKFWVTFIDENNAAD